MTSGIQRTIIYHSSEGRRKASAVPAALAPRLGAQRHLRARRARGRLVLGALAARRWCAAEGGLARAWRGSARPLHAEHIVGLLLTCNFVGVAFWRSLHFQFYCWYLHGVPLLLWRCAALPLALKLLTYALLEYAFSYGLDRVEGTSTPASSAALLLAHAIILYALCRAEPPPTYADERPPARPLARSD